MVKRTALAVLLVAVFAIGAFAGEGSDTIGACRLMPELRYSYYETPVTSHDFSVDIDGDVSYPDWRQKEHDAVAQLTWGVTDNLDLFTFVGVRICPTFEGGVSAGGDDFDFIVDPVGAGFTCGLGVKGTFWRSPSGFYAGGGASIVYGVSNHKNPFKIYINDVLDFDSIADRGVYLTEQELAVTADLHAGWSFEKIGLTPYVGVEYRWYDVYLDTHIPPALGIPEECASFREKNPVGVYVGVDYLIANRVKLNLEGHMINRWGGSFSVGYVFDICGAPEVVVPPVAPVIEPKIEPMSKN